MKVLLFGDYSGFHRSLAQGMKEAGHDVIAISSGDNFKKISSDINLCNTADTRTMYKIFGYFYNLLAILSLCLRRYDIIQLVNPFFYGVRNARLGKFLLNLLLSRSRLRSLAVVGCDSFVHKSFLRRELFEGLCKRCSNIDYGQETCPYSSQDTVAWNRKVMNKIDCLVTGYEGAYFEAYSEFRDKQMHPINLPVNLDEISYTINEVREKLTILHGVTRLGFKGSDISLLAMKRLQEEFPEKVELIVVTKLPYLEYLQKLAECNIVVDQIYGDVLGLNALISMAAGKVVLTSYKRALFDHICPAIEIRSNAENIYIQLKNLLGQIESMPKIGSDSRAYVQRFHDHKLIANQTLSFWDNLLHT